MIVRDVIDCLEEIVPLSYQEDYDNSGLQVGDPKSEINSAILAVDITDEVIDEAISAGSGMIVSHHPLLFDGLKKLNSNNRLEKMIIKAIKNDIAIYSSHTNLDNIPGGVSYRMANKMGVEEIFPLVPLKGKLLKLVVFVPPEHAGKVRDALFSAGAGHIGKYSRCSYNTEGKGTFKGDDSSKPFAGKKGMDHFEEELRIETILPDHLKYKVISAMTTAHPYEEVAYDLYKLDNNIPGAGLGCIGNLKAGLTEEDFLSSLGSIFGADGIRHSRLRKKKINRVAFCGGSGGALVNDAIDLQADAFVTGDIKYHSFFEANDHLLLVDIGHFESEKFSLEVLYEIIRKKIPKFAVNFSKINTNPINYLQAWQK